MKGFTLILSFLFVFMFSCKWDNKTPVSKSVKFDKKQYAIDLKKDRDSFSKSNNGQLKPQKKKVKAVKRVQKQIEFYQKTDTINLKIVYGKAKIDTLKQPRQKVVFVFDSDTANKLQLRLESQDTLSNLRISQIIDNKGNSDGPFGREIEYKILEKGKHYVIVSENQMQGEPWGGRFTFEVRLGW